MLIFWISACYSDSSGERGTWWVAEKVHVDCHTLKHSGFTHQVKFHLNTWTLSAEECIKRTMHLKSYLTYVHWLKELSKEKTRLFMHNLPILLWFQCLLVTAQLRQLIGLQTFAEAYSTATGCLSNITSSGKAKEIVCTKFCKKY